MCANKFRWLYCKSSRLQLQLWEMISAYITSSFPVTELVQVFVDVQCLSFPIYLEHRHRSCSNCKALSEKLLFVNAKFDRLSSLHSVRTMHVVERVGGKDQDICIYLKYIYIERDRERGGGGGESARVKESLHCFTFTFSFTDLAINIFTK